MSTCRSRIVIYSDGEHGGRDRKPSFSVDRVSVSGDRFLCSWVEELEFRGEGQTENIGVLTPFGKI